MATIQEILGSEAFQALDAEGQRSYADDLLRRHSAAYLQLEGAERTEYLDNLINRSRPKGWIEAGVSMLPVVGPLAGQFAYGREPKSVSAERARMSLGALAPEVGVMPETTGEVGGTAATLTRAREQLFLMGLTQNIGSTLGFAGHTLKSFVTREAIDNTAYALGELAFDRPESAGEAALHLGSAAVGAAALGTTGRVLARSIGNLIGTDQAISRRLAHEFGSSSAVTDFINRANQTSVGNIIDNFSDAELDSIIRVTGAGRGRVSRELHDMAIQLKDTRQGVIRAVEAERYRGLTEVGGEATARDISDTRMNEMLARTFGDAQDRVNQQIDAAEMHQARYATQERFELSTEGTTRDIANTRLQASLSENAIVAQEKILAEQFKQTGRRLVAHAELRARAGLPAAASDEALHTMDTSDFRVLAELRLRDIERRVLDQSLNAKGEFRQRYEVATQLAEGRGTQIGNVSGTLGPQSVALRNLDIDTAAKLQTDLRASGMDHVRVGYDSNTNTYGLFASLRESADEVNAGNLWNVAMRNASVVDATQRTYSGLTLDENVSLARFFGASESEVAKLQRFINSTLDQANEAKVTQRVTTSQLGVPTIQEQIASGARSAAQIRHDVGQVMPAPRPFLVGEPIRFDAPDGEHLGTVSGIAIDRNGKQSIVAALPNGTEMYVTDDMVPRHIFDPAPTVQPSSVPSAHMGNFHAADPQLNIPNIRVLPGELDKGINALRASGVKVTKKSMADGVMLNIDGVVQGKFNEREAEAIVENLLRSKIAQQTTVNRLGGPNCF